eukprot:SAG11_NODE_10_length_27955_cov_15.365235_1_plen_197_part_00
MTLCFFKSTYGTTLSAARGRYRRHTPSRRRHTLVLTVTNDAIRAVCEQEVFEQWRPDSLGETIIIIRMIYYHIAIIIITIIIIWSCLFYPRPIHIPPYRPRAPAQSQIAFVYARQWSSDLESPSPGVFMFALSLTKPFCSAADAPDAPPTSSAARRQGLIYLPQSTRNGSSASMPFHKNHSPTCHDHLSHYHVVPH